MDESIEQLQKEYLGALDARIKADTGLMNLLPKGHLGAQQAAEWRDALNADYAAERALIKARKAYEELSESVK